MERPDPPVKQFLRGPAFASLLVGACAMAVFWRTAYPTITWWDSSNYSLAAVTLGLTSSPGSLLLTLVGWAATRLPIPLSEAHTLNLVAGVLGAAASAMVLVVAVRIHGMLSASATAANWSVLAGAGLGALAFAFSVTLWEHAIKFTPYVLTVVFTGLILLTLVRWWEAADRPESWRWIALLTFLFGFDFSVHRTNALLIPGALAWILVRRPRTLADSRSWFAAIGGMASGLSFQLLVMPISSITTSPLNMFQPDTWSRFWDYVSLAQTGGNFQLTLWPRKSPFWSNQVADVLQVFGANVLHHQSSLRIAGWLPGLTGLVGLAYLWRRAPRFALAFSILFLLQLSATVLYFNIPADFFRSLDRHYLPVLTTFAVAIAVGAGAVMLRLADLWKRVPAVAVGIAAVLLFVPIVQLVGNWQANDASRRYFTHDLAVNALEELPKNAFYFTVGDNDTFPAMYVQAVEGIRPDVRIVNLSLANTDWYIDQLRARDTSFPVKGSSAERGVANASTWRDSTLVVRMTGADDRAVPAVAAGTDSVVFRPVPQFADQPLAAENVMLEIVKASGFTTPVTVSLTAGPSGLAWLRPHARMDGFHWRIVPAHNPRPDVALLRANLLARNRYRGYADSAVMLDDVTRVMGSLYLESFKTLMEGEMATGNVDGCREIEARVRALLPSLRLTSARGAPPPIASICGS